MPELVRPGLEYSQFVEEHLLPRVPVIVPEAMSESRAVAVWTPAFFLENYGARSVRIDRAGERVMVPLAEYLESIESVTAQSESPSYLRNDFLSEFFPELHADFEVPEYCKPNWFETEVLGKFVPQVWSDWVELFISAPRTRFPGVHVDSSMTHGWAGQIYGKKAFWFWPPMKDQPRYSVHSQEQERLRGLYCLGRDLEGFFSHARPIRAELGPGDFLFIPAGWWHTAESLTTSITLSGNFVNESNWSEFCESWFGGLRFLDGFESLAQARSRLVGSK